MIRRESLQVLQQGFKVKGGANVYTYEVIQSLVQQKADEYGIPIAMEMDIIQSGSLFSKQEQPCLTIYHPEHPTDYFRYCIIQRAQGIFAYIEIYYYGSSKLTGKYRTKEERQKSGNFTSSLMGLLTTVDNVAFDAENDYYDALKDIIAEAFS